MTTITFGTQTVVTTVRLKPQADASSIDNCQRSDQKVATFSTQVVDKTLPKRFVDSL